MNALKIFRTASFLLFLSLYASFNALCAKEIVVENPPFSISYNNFIEVEKVILRDDATILHLKADSHPAYWFRIDTGTYIRANGEKLLVKSAEGIQLDTEIFSEPIQFSLTFPPIDKNTERIDFIETDCENCFKIWGIELKSSTLTNRVELPAAIKNYSANLNDSSPLKVAGFNAGNATLKGQFLGYVSDLKSEITVYVNNPITGVQESYEAEVQDDGRFEILLPVVATTQVLFRTNTPNFNETMVVSPNEETSVYFDLQQKACQESRTRIDRCEKSKWIYFGGANADLNNQYFDAEISSLVGHYFNYGEIIAKINGMMPNEYKSYLLNKSDEAIKALENKPINAKVKELATLNISFQASHFLMMAKYFLESAYRNANNLDYRSELIGYDEPVFDLAYYDFLKQLPYNDLNALYSNQYSYTVNEIKHIKYFLDEKYRRIEFTTQMMQQLVKENEMTFEELLYVDFFTKSEPENWSKQKLDAKKKTYIGYVNDLISKQELSKKELELANQLKTLSENKKTKAQDINTAYQDLFIELSTSGKYNPTELKAKTVSYKGMEQDTLGGKYADAFNAKYQEQMNALLEEKDLDNTKEVLAKILGVNNGLLFDLIAIQTYSRSLEESMPLSDDKLKKIAALGNNFYLTYLTEKNNQLLASIEENKKKGGYNVHTISPDVKNEQLFEELRKSFEGKVVFLNFWETWCAPCRMAMKQFYNTKETFKGKDIAFVYVASERSPKSAWQNSIPNIWGEHFYLTLDQFDYLSKNYGITGVPTYFIFDKEGKQIHHEVGLQNMNEMTKKLMEALEK